MERLNWSFLWQIFNIYIYIYIYMYNVRTFNFSFFLSIIDGMIIKQCFLIRKNCFLKKNSTEKVRKFFPAGIYTELLYKGSSWSSWLCSSMWRCPQEYIAYELVSTSPAASHMPGSSYFDSFFLWVVGGRTAAALWDVVFRTCSILLTAFLCSCRQSFLHTFS